VTNTHQPPPLVPRLWLLAPPLLPALVPVLAFVAEMFGHQWDHGNAILFVLGLEYAVAIAFIIEVVALIIAVRALRTADHLRKTLDLFCVLFGIAFVIGTVVLVGLLYPVA
jgi:hypothetical protein